MRINTVSKFTGPNEHFAKDIIKRIFGRPIPDDVRLVDIQDDINTGGKVIRWVTTTGTHSMTLDQENMEDSLTSILVTMRMTC